MTSAHISGTQDHSLCSARGSCSWAEVRRTSHANLRGHQGWFTASNELGSEWSAYSASSPAGFLCQDCPNRSLHQSPQCGLFDAGSCGQLYLPRSQSSFASSDPVSGVSIPIDLHTGYFHRLAMKLGTQHTALFFSIEKDSGLKLYRWRATWRAYRRSSLTRQFWTTIACFTESPMHSHRHFLFTHQTLQAYDRNVYKNMFVYAKRTMMLLLNSKTT